jgi:hypothetical protein
VVRRSRQDGAALSLPTAFNRLPLAFLPALLSLAACTRPNPDYCDRTGPCGVGKLCNVLTNTCEAAHVAADADVDVDAGPDAAADAATRDARDTCARDEDCPGDDKPMCLRGLCRKCLGADDCGNATPACGPAGRCVECTDDKSCTSTRPVCDLQAQKCVACTSDAQCAKKLGMDPGVCMAHDDGRCATVAETVFVQSVAGCSTMVGAGGTPAMPYCLAQDGITAATAGGKPLVVMRGPIDRWSYAGTGTVTVVGQNGAKVVGAGVGVRVSAGELYLRGLTISVSGATGTGIVAENGAVLRMNRCLVENNGAGGIAVNKAGFDIVNTIIAGNEPGETTPGSGLTFGGVYLDAAPGKPQRFVNDTIVGNKAIGVYCAGAYPVTGLLANGNSVNQLHMCLATSSNLTDPPQFDPARPYHLTAGSPCTNMGDATEFPPDDYDGDPRPQMSRSDCGADELR